MPKGLLLIGFDTYEGAVVTHRVPEDLEVPDPIIQHIQITHNFISTGWLPKKKVSTVSLTTIPSMGWWSCWSWIPRRSPDFRIIIDQVNDVLLTDPDPSAIESELQRIFTLVFSVLKARESVLMKLSPRSGRVSHATPRFDEKCRSYLKSYPGWDCPHLTLFIIPWTGDLWRN